MEKYCRHVRVAIGMEENPDWRNPQHVRDKALELLPTVLVNCGWSEMFPQPDDTDYSDPEMRFLEEPGDN